MGWFDWLKIRPKGKVFSERLDIEGPPKNIEFVPVSQKYEVTIDVESFPNSVLGRTYSKNGKLYCSIDDEMELPALNASNMIRKDEQRMAVWIHELMHVALWDRNDITHSNDPKSLLYYKVTGENKVPTQWDLSIMLGATHSIGQISLLKRFSTAKWPLCAKSLIYAVDAWNKWLGKEFFVIVG